jgi:hypothetical protein
MSGEGVISHRNAVTTRMRRGTIICPVCNHDAGIRDSDQETDLVKNLWCICLNVGCGHTFKMQLSFTYTISPSAIERPDLQLPQAPPEFVRHIYPSGPPAPAADPNQFSIFDVEGVAGSAAIGPAKHHEPA